MYILNLGIIAIREWTMVECISSPDFSPIAVSIRFVRKAIIALLL